MGSNRKINEDDEKHDQDKQAFKVEVTLCAKQTNDFRVEQNVFLHIYSVAHQWRPIGVYAPTAHMWPYGEGKTW